MQDTNQLDFIVAPGSHPPLSEENLRELVGISAEEQTSTFKHIGLLNYAWDTPAQLA